MLDYLFQNGFFDRIYDRTGLIIGTYDERLAPPEKPPILMAMLDEELANLRSGGGGPVPVRPEAGRQTELPRAQVEDALKGMKTFLAQAAHKGRGVWFVF